MDGSIHRAAGPELLTASLALGGCAVGEAKATPGFELPSTWVFHAVGLIWYGGNRAEEAALASCYRRCLELPTAHAVKTIAFPAISTGVYGFPHELAADIAVGTVKEWAHECGVERVIFCCSNRQTATIYNHLLS